MKFAVVLHSAPTGMDSMPRRASVEPPELLGAMVKLNATSSAPYFTMSETRVATTDVDVPLVPNLNGCFAASLRLDLGSWNGWWDRLAHGSVRPAGLRRW